MAAFDRRGVEILMGDIVYRVKFSHLTVHRVLAITKRGNVLLSSKVETTTYEWGGGSRSYNSTRDTYTLESLSEHNSKFYYYPPRDFLKTGLIKH